MPESAMLAAQDLAARRGRSLLWQGLGFSIGAGGALVVRGANGSGKTTLLRILAGLTRAENGTIDWRGQRVEPFAQALRDDLVFIGHAPALKDELTAQENLMSLATLAADANATPARVNDALSAIGLAAQMALPARVLSQGQRRRVHLAQLAMTSRPLWILDEPATALDREGLAWLEAALSSHLARGGVAALAPHAPIVLAGCDAVEITL